MPFFRNPFADLPTPPPEPSPPAPAPGPDVDVPHDTVISAEVNRTPEITLFDPRGFAVRVGADQVDYFIREYKFSRVKADPKWALHELQALWPAVYSAWERAVLGITETGQIETHPDAALHVAQMGFEQLATTIHDIHRDLHALYPTIPDPDQDARNAAAAEADHA